MPAPKSPETSSDSSFLRVVDYFLKTEKQEGDRPKTSQKGRGDSSSRKKTSTKAKKRS